MRWDLLFADLEAQLDDVHRVELLAEVADRSRREAATIRLVDRLRACAGTVDLHVLGPGRLGGRVVEVAAEWALLEDRPHRQSLVPLRAVLGVTGLGAAARVPGDGGLVLSRLGLGYALRALARNRAAVTVQLVDGSSLDGTLDRVGADHVDLAVHPLEEGRRGGSVRESRTVPFAALAAVRGQ